MIVISKQRTSTYNFKNDKHGSNMRGNYSNAEILN